VEPRDNETLLSPFDECGTIILDLKSSIHFKEKLGGFGKIPETPLRN
jgi:hypothetical protein